MPIPFLLAGLGITAGVIGAGGHVSAKETNEKAQRVSESAQKLYNNAKYSLERAQNETEKALLKLGYEKKQVLDSSMKQFLASYDKIKHIQQRESVGMNELSKFTIDQQDAVELREMTDIYSSSLKSGATGAAAGAIVALAASGSLTVVTGGLTAAGTALMAGEISAAAGIAGSALSFGAAMTPLAAVAAPVILFTGISASMKADENLEKANTMYAEAEAASEKMKVSETLCGAISDRAKMFDGLLADLNEMFAECAGLLAGVIKKKEGTVFKKKITSEDLTEDELKLIAVTRSLAGAVKAVIDTPILSKDGNISYESKSVYTKTLASLPNFEQAVEEVKSIPYHVKPIEARATKASSGSNGKAAGEMTVMDGARKVFAFIAAYFAAASFAGGIALRITGEGGKFLFFNSYTANHIALWLFLFATVTMLVGKFKYSKVESICAFASGLSLVILFVQYCRSVERMDHSIIFSLAALAAFVLIYGFFDGKKDKWQFGQFFSAEAMCMVLWPLGFLVYAFFSKFLGFSSSVCLVVVSIIVAYVIFCDMLEIVRGNREKTD